MHLNKPLLYASTQAAFIAISSRIVGSAFRYLETLNPDFQETKVISNPSTVLFREAVTLGMAWGFSFLASTVIKPMAQKKKWGDFRVQFLTAVIGTTIAEFMGRLIAYRKSLNERKVSVNTVYRQSDFQSTRRPVMRSKYRAPVYTNFHTNPMMGTIR